MKGAKTNGPSRKVVGSAVNAKTTTSKERRNATDARKPKMPLTSKENHNT